MKNLLFLLVLFVISCEQKEKESPIIVSGHEFLISGDGYGTLFELTVVNSGKAHVDSFKVESTLIVNGEKEVAISKGYDVAPYQEKKIYARFVELVVVDENYQLEFDVK